MCTAVSSKGFFGRNLDVETEYGQKILISPRNFPFKFRKVNEIKNHYGITGVGIEKEGYPLYFDAVNEKGLGMAGLNFPRNADYKEFCEDRENITPFEFIPYILSLCKNTAEAKARLEKVNLFRMDFSEDLSLSPLHFIISDKEESIVVECVREGLKVYENKIGILTNNPPFPVQVFNLNNYMSLSKNPPVNNFSKEFDFDVYSRGMGGMGLPGDLSSMSRFVRGTFNSLNMVGEGFERLFHILYSVYQQKGCVQLSEGIFEYTSYTSVYDLQRGILYYTTYNNRRISCADMHKANLESARLLSFKMNEKEDIFEHRMF